MPGMCSVGHRQRHHQEARRHVQQIDSSSDSSLNCWSSCPTWLYTSTAPCSGSGPPNTTPGDVTARIQSRRACRTSQAQCQSIHQHRIINLQRAGILAGVPLSVLSGHCGRFHGCPRQKPSAGTREVYLPGCSPAIQSKRDSSTRDNLLGLCSMASPLKIKDQPFRLACAVCFLVSRPIEPGFRAYMQLCAIHQPIRLPSQQANQYHYAC